MELKDIVQTLLNKRSYPGELLDTSKALSEFFEKFSHISTKNIHCEIQKDGEHTYLDSGVAISPLDAAICTNEYLRTAKYIRGVYEGINDLLSRFKEDKVHILYAGCGPYATLIIPILAFFDPKRVEVSFLDIHQSSLDSVKNILKGLGLEDFVYEYIQDDATKYKISKDTHMIITETMKAAFDDEPQVSITLNLLPQLHSDGIFIPNRVVVGFEAADYKMVTKDNMISKEKDSKYLCDVMDIDSSRKIQKENIIVTKAYEVLDDIEEKLKPQLTTTIYIYKEHILKENECSLNIPKKMKLSENLFRGSSISFDYKFGKKPELTYEHTLN